MKRTDFDTQFKSSVRVKDGRWSVCRSVGYRDGSAKAVQRAMDQRYLFLNAVERRFPKVSDLNWQATAAKPSIRHTEHSGNTFQVKPALPPQTSCIHPRPWVNPLPQSLSEYFWEICLTFRPGRDRALSVKRAVSMELLVPLRFLDVSFALKSEHCKKFYRKYFIYTHDHEQPYEIYLRESLYRK